jgi:hypothetical protein
LNLFSIAHQAAKTRRGAPATLAVQPARSASVGRGVSAHELV